MTSIADRIRAGDPTALYAADVVQWCMDDPIGRALVDRVRALEAENAANIERWQVYESLCDEIMAEKEAAEDRVRALEAERDELTAALALSSRRVIRAVQEIQRATTPPREVDQ